LDFLIIKVSTNKSLNNIDGSKWVLGCLVLGGFSDEFFIISEGNKGWSNSVCKFIWNDFNSSVFENTNARICGTEIDTNDWAFNLLLFGACVGYNASNKCNE